MPRYRVEPHDDQAPFSKGRDGDGPELETIETTFCDSGKEIFFCSGYSAREIAERHQRESGGTIYVNAVSRRIARKDYNLATNAPVYYAVAEQAIYTLLRKDERVVRAYWPELGK